MPASIATIGCAFFVAAVFMLNRDRESRSSWALWIPVVWLAICSSRTVSQWLGGIGTDGPAQTAFVEGNPLDAAIYAGLLAAGLMVLWGRRRVIGSFLRANTPLLLFFLYCLISVSWSDYSVVSFKRWTKELGDLTMIMIVLTDSAPIAAMKRFLTRPGYVLVPLSIVLIRYYTALGRQYSGYTGEAYNIGAATGKNGLGFVCLVYGLGFGWCFLEALRSKTHDRKTGVLIANGMMLLLVLWLFRMAGSATSLSCFLMGGGLMVVTRLFKFKRSTALLQLLVASMLFVVLYATILSPESGLVGMVGRDPSLTGRTEIWNVVLSVPVNRVVGAGYESFWLGKRLETIWRIWGIPFNQAHDGYLQVFLDLGVIGLILLGIVIFWGYRNVFRAVRLDPEAGRIRLAFFFVALVYNLTEHAFRELHPVWLCFLLSIVAIPQLRNSEDPSLSSDPSDYIAETDLQVHEVTARHALSS
jgi:exopolysaccharide production protein ExoQ